MSTFDMLTCHRNEDFFIQKYFMTNNPFKGLSLIEPSPKQLHLLSDMTYSTFVVDIVTERQIGVSTMFAAHALWLALFRANVTIVLMGKENKNAKELRELVKTGYDNLPEWLQEKRTVDNVGYTEFANGSRIFYKNSDPENMHGLMVNYIFLDTFDEYTENRQAELYKINDNFSHRFYQVAVL